MLCGHEREDGTINFRQRTLGAFVAVYLMLHCIPAVLALSVQPFRQAADWLYTQSNTIFNDDTVMVTTSPYSDGWNDYYISQRGRRDPLHVMSQYQFEKVLQGDHGGMDYDRIYLQYSMAGIGAQLRAYLDENYVLEADKTDIQVKEYVHK